MKNILLTVAALLIVGVAWAESPNIINGDPVSVRIVNAMNSKTQPMPSAIVDANITDAEGNILIKRGTPVQLSVEAQRARGVGKAGYLIIRCLSTTAVDGQTIFLAGGLSAYGNEREELAIGLGVGAGIVVFPFGLFCLCIKGEEAHIPSNTILTNIVIDDSYTINY